MNRRQLLIGGGSVVALGAGVTLLGAAQMGSASDYTAATEAMRLPLAAHPDAHEYFRFATLAPNGHNTRPWQFTVAPRRITIAPDRSRRTRSLRARLRHDRSPHGRPRSASAPVDRSRYLIAYSHSIVPGGFDV